MPFNYCGYLTIINEIHSLLKGKIFGYLPFPFLLKITKVSGIMDELEMVNLWIIPRNPIIIFHGKFDFGTSQNVRCTGKFIIISEFGTSENL